MIFAPVIQPSKVTFAPVIQPSKVINQNNVQVDIPEHDETLVVERDPEGRAKKIRKSFKKKGSE
jgi:hypothetical protein